MNEQVLNEYLNGTAIEDMDIVIYDYQIEGVKTMQEARVRADRSVDEMLKLGYRIEERNGRHYFEVKK